LESLANVHHTSPFFPSLCALDGEAEPHITASRIRVLSRLRVAPHHGRPGRPTQGEQRESILRGTALVPPDQSPISRHLSHLSPSHQFADDQTDAEPSPRDLNTLLLQFHFLDPDETPPYNSWKPGRPQTSGLRGETYFVYANGRVQERGLSEQASLPPARRLLSHLALLSAGDMSICKPVFHGECDVGGRRKRADHSPREIDANHHDDYQHGLAIQGSGPMTHQGDVNGMPRKRAETSPSRRSIRASHAVLHRSIACSLLSLRDYITASR
jgi:hypothetical protein